MNPDEDRRRRRVGALVRLYPPSWRRRYGEEFAALLADTGTGIRVLADVLAAAATAWACPPTRVHTRSGRMRATVSVTLCSWSLAAAVAVLFAKLTRDGAVYLVDRADPVRAWCYNVYALAGCVSAVVMLAGGLLPVAAATVRACAPGRQRRRVAGLLAAPPLAVSGFLGAATAVARLTGAHEGTRTGVGAGWFLALAGLGLLGAAVCAAAPAAAITWVPSHGPVLAVAVVAGTCASGLMAIAILASLAYQATATGASCRAAMLGYAAVTTTALVVAVTSSVRGIRAWRAPTPAAGR